MTKKTKIFIIFALTLALLLSLGTFALASEPEDLSVTDSSESEAPSENISDNIADEPSTDSDGSKENIFDTLYGFLTQNADKIFSCLAFIGALILSFAYKKGLFPFVKNAISSLTGVVKSLREESEKGALANSQFMEDVSKKLALSESILKGAEEKISELEKKLSEAYEKQDKTEELRAVMLAEVEMIYNIFISSSLPQYQKDKVGEAYGKMMETLKGKEA